MISLSLAVESDVPFARLTTLGVGGPAKRLVPCVDPATVVEAVALADQQGLELFVLGGGSNLLVADAGWDGLVLRVTGGRLDLRDEGTVVRLYAEAGACWDDVVARAVSEGLGGIECLSGIPGDAGAAPIQNIGAYGQEVAETLDTVYVVERASGHARRIAAADCGFGYRTSHFKTRWKDRYVVIGMDLLLPKTDQGTVRYRDLVERLADHEDRTPRAVREAVLAIRRSKSMVLDHGDPNRRSAGSFFTNPVISAERADRLSEVAVRRGLEGGPPRFEQPGGQVKVSAAWLIEAAGFARGTRRGRVGLSTRHALALVNLGGATADEIVALARAVRGAVREFFGVTLEPEPTLLGFDQDIESLLG